MIINDTAQRFTVYPHFFDMFLKVGGYFFKPNAHRPNHKIYVKLVSCPACCTSCLQKIRHNSHMLRKQIQQTFFLLIRTWKITGETSNLTLCALCRDNGGQPLRALLWHCAGDEGSAVSHGAYLLCTSWETLQHHPSSLQVPQQRRGTHLYPLPSSYQLIVY